MFAGRCLATQGQGQGSSLQCMSQGKGLCGSQSQVGLACVPEAVGVTGVP